MIHKQNEIIFLNIRIGNADNTVDFRDEEPETYDTLKGAIEAGKEKVKEYGMREYVYKCIPVIRIDRGKIRVTHTDKFKAVMEGE
jgi:hypothetical protein